jgi:hypothetical protein
MLLIERAVGGLEVGEASSKPLIWNLYSFRDRFWQAIALRTPKCVVDAVIE